MTRKGHGVLLIWAATLCVLTTFAASAAGGDVSLAWDPNTEADLAGYKVYYGTASGNYATSVDVGNVTSYTVPGLVPGTYFFSATAYNTARLESSYSNEVSTTVPGTSCSYAISPTGQSVGTAASTGTITVATSAGCAWTASSNSAWISITAGASGSGPGSVGYSVAANSTSSSRTGTLTIAGQTFSVSQSPDSSAPSTAIASPTSGTTYISGTASLSLAGTASDNLAVTSVSWSSDRGGSGSCTGTTTWSCSGVALQSGQNVLTVAARDAANNAGTDVLTVTYTPPDTQAPSITITSPTSSATYTASSSSVTIGGTASDNFGVASVSWSSDRGGSGSCTGTTTWSCSGVALQSGQNILTVTARDAANNAGTDVLTVTYTPTDTQTPSITITSPASSATYTANSSSVTIGGTASDNVGVTSVSWSSDRGGSGGCIGRTNWRCSGIALQSGQNVLTVTARDAANNAGTNVLTVTCTPSDTQLPSITITSPTSSATYTASSSSVTIGGTASDSVGVTSVSWSSDRGGSGSCTGATNWSCSGVALQSGQNVVTVTARNAASNASTDVLTVTYTPADTQSPSITITSPSSQGIYTADSGTVALGGTASDNVGVTQVTWTNSLGGSGTAVGTMTWSATGILLQSGANVITVTAHDHAGNSSSVTLTINYSAPVDSAAPAVSITSPSRVSPYVTTGVTLSLSGTASDNIGVTGVAWSNDRGGSGDASGTSSWTVPAVPLQVGRNVITITARDAAGNSGTANLTVVYSSTEPGTTDTTPPVIDALVAVANETSAIIQWGTNERADSDVEYGLTATYGSKTETNSALVTAHSQRLSNLSPDTTYHYRVHSRDAQGNLALSADFVFKTGALSFSEARLRMFYPSLTVSPRGHQAGEEQEYTSVALSSVDVDAMILRFTAFDTTGAAIQTDGIVNPKVTMLGPGEQIPIIDVQLFGEAIATQDLGWIKVESTSSKLTGFFLNFNAGLTFMDGAEIASSLQRITVLPEIGDEELIKLLIVNPNDSAASVTLDLIRADGKVRASVQQGIKPNGALSADLLNELMPGVAPEPSDYLKISSDTGILAYEVFGKKSKDVAILSGQDLLKGASVLYSPQYVVGGSWRTTLSLVNLDPVPGTATVRLIADDGTQIGPVKYLGFPPRGKAYVSDQAFFEVPPTPADQFTQGYVEIVGNGIRLAGDVVFGDARDDVFRTALPLVASLADSFVFSHVAVNDIYFTGFSLLNPNAEDASVTIELFSSDGKLMASGNLSVMAGQKVARLLSQFFDRLSGGDTTSGYFRVRSDHPIACFALFGTSNLSILSAIPAQQAP